jgi:hypothetical protein
MINKLISQKFVLTPREECPPTKTVLTPPEDFPSLDFQQAVLIVDVTPRYLLLAKPQPSLEFRLSFFTV